MALLKQSTAYLRAFLLVESADHITGLTAASPTVNISKAGAAFAAAAGTVTEIANGWYKVALTTGDTGTLGDLAFHITATSADPTDFVDQVVVDIPGGSVSSVTGAVGSVTGAVGSVTGNVGGSVASVTGAVGSVTGNVGGNVVGSVASVTAGVTVSTNNDKAGYSLTQAFPTNFSSMAISAGGGVAPDWANIKSPTTAVDLSGTTIKNLDGNTVQTGDAYARLGAPAGASVSADIAAVKGVLPSALTAGGNIKADALALNGDTTAATNLGKSAASIARGTATTGATTTSIPTSSITPSASVADEFKGRTVIFDADTTTAALRGQAATISTNTNLGVLTVSALTTAPANGDSFSIV